MRVNFTVALVFGLLAIFPSLSSADDIKGAQKLVASSLANVDRAEQVYLRNMVIKPCTKIKNALIDNLFAICSSLGGVSGHRLLDSDPLSCTQANVYCGYSKVVAKLAKQKVIYLGKSLPKKMNSLNSRVAAINRSIIQINSQVSKRTAQRDIYATKCALDPIKNKSSCTRAASVNAVIEKANARIVLKQSALSVLNDGISLTYDKIAHIVSFDGGAGYAIRIRAAHEAQEEKMCARIEVACVSTPSPSPTPQVSPSPEPTPGTTPGRVVPSPTLTP